MYIHAYKYIYSVFYICSYICSCHARNAAWNWIWTSSPWGATRGFALILKGAFSLYSHTHTHTHSLTYSHIHIFICIKSWPCPEICWTGNCFNTPEIAGELHKLTRNAPWAQSNVMRPRHQCGQRGKRKCCHCVCVWECGCVWGGAFYWVFDGGASKE